MKKICLLILMFAASGLVLAADILYVHDKLIITMRTGPSGTYKIVRSLTSGAKLTPIETSDDNRYTNVRTEDGTEGWVLSQYLVDQPAAKDLLVVAEQKISRYEKEQIRLKERIKSLNERLSESKGTATRLLNESKSLKSEIADISKAAARPIAIERQNKDLMNTLNQVQKDFQIMRSENHILKDKSEKEWFVAGGGILLLGIILGIVIPRIRWRRKDSWGSL